MTKADIKLPPLPEPEAVINGIRVWTIVGMSNYEMAIKAALQHPGEPVDPPGDNFGSAEHWKEKAQLWADEAHKLRQQAMRGCPESDKWNCKYCHRVNSCPVKHLRDAQPADPLQGAANWLIEAIDNCRPTDIRWRLSIGHNRAQRLHAAAMEQKP